MRIIRLTAGIGYASKESTLMKEFDQRANLPAGQEWLLRGSFPRERQLRFVALRATPDFFASDSNSPLRCSNLTVGRSKDSQFRKGKALIVARLEYKVSRQTNLYITAMLAFKRGKKAGQTTVPCHNRR